MPLFVWHTGLGGERLGVSPIKIAGERDVHPCEAVEMLGLNSTQDVRGNSILERLG